MRDMLAQEEQKAQREVDHELENSQMKLCNFMQTLNKNDKNMRKAREDLTSLLTESQTVSFLQVG